MVSRSLSQSDLVALFWAFANFFFARCECAFSEEVIRRAWGRRVSFCL
jgi:hypothetical protein